MPRRVVFRDLVRRVGLTAVRRLAGRLRGLHWLRQLRYSDLMSPTSKSPSTRARAAKARGTGGARPSATAAKKGQAASRSTKRGGQRATTRAGARVAVKDPMTRALRVIFGKQSLTADAAAVALVNGSAPALKDLRDLIDRALATAPASDLDETVWGREPSEADVARAQADTDRAREAALQRTLSDALTREQVAARLGISTQAVSKRTSLDQLVALRYGGRWWYPRWQFADDDVVPVLHELGEHFPSALSLTTWMTTPFADLDEVTPAEMLRRRGGPERVLRLAQATSAEAW